MSFEIVTDSCSNLTNEIIDKYNLYVVSLMFRVGDKEFYSYVKGEDNDLQKFYMMMRNKENITTSCISVEDCVNICEEILQEGKDLLFIGFSSALSATVQAADNAIRMLKDKYPERKMYCVDTLSASLGEGLLVTYAAKMRDTGKSIEEVYQWLLDNRLKLCHWFTVDDLFFLKRGGRVNAAAAIFGSLLGIKPVMHVDDAGRLIPVSKVRGRKKSLDALVDNLRQTAIDPEKQIVYISHGDCIDDANYVADKIREEFHVKEIVINYVDPVIGAHSGPGTVALFFLGTKR